MNMIMWTAEKLKQFKKKYAATKDGENFTFDENLFVKSYAKYLIEHLDERFHYLDRR